MNFEEIKRKLEEINRRMDRYSVQQLNDEFNKVYEEAKGSAVFGQDLKNTMNEIMDVNKGAVAKGNKGTLTKEQMDALEEKLGTINNAMKEAKELRDNSEIDKIDDYMGQKIEENEEAKELYKEENNGLKAQKVKLDPIYDKYQVNKNAEEVAQKIAKIMGEMSSQFDRIANSQDPEEQKEATMEDLINNTDKVTEIKYRGDFWNEHRYFEAKIPVIGRIFKNRYAKQYLNYQKAQYRNKVANLVEKSQGMRKGKGKEFVQAYRENISANHDIIQKNIDATARQMYGQNMEKGDR